MLPEIVHNIYSHFKQVALINWLDKINNIHIIHEYKSAEQVQKIRSSHRSLDSSMRSSTPVLEFFKSTHKVGNVANFLFPYYLLFPPLFDYYNVSKCEMLFSGILMGGLVNLLSGSLHDLQQDPLPCSNRN